MMNLEESEINGVAVARLIGEFDLSQSFTMQTWFAKKAAVKTMLVILDFAEVRFIDSSGIATLIGFYKAASEYGGKLALVGVRPPLMSVFNLVSLGTFIPIYENTGEALQKLV